MRIAFAGSHRVGKTTLIQAVADRLPEPHTIIDEPYEALEEEGHQFSHPPTVEDYEAQLKQSLASIDDADADSLFDRSPLDFLAYILAIDPGYDVEPWREKLEDVLGCVNLVVFVPIEDAVVVRDGEDLALREQVNERLRELLEEHMPAWVRWLEVSGPVDARAALVIDELDKL